jgi:serine/threonine protein phosphatase PrpC
MSTRAVAAGDRYLVLCTDGVTDVMTEDEVAAFVAGAVKRADELGAQHIATEYEEEKEAAEQPDPGKRSRAMRRAVLSAVSQWLCLHARSLGSVDDVSAIVVELNAGAHS